MRRSYEELVGVVRGGVGRGGKGGLLAEVKNT